MRCSSLIDWPVYPRLRRLCRRQIAGATRLNLRPPTAAQYAGCGANGPKDPRPKILGHSPGGASHDAGRSRVSVRRSVQAVCGFVIRQRPALAQQLLSPAAPPQKQAIDRGPPDLETLRDLGGAQALGLEGGDLGGVDRGWAALVDDPEPRCADPLMAEPMRCFLGHCSHLVGRDTDHCAALTSADALVLGGQFSARYGHSRRPILRRVVSRPTPRSVEPWSGGLSDVRSGRA